MADFARWSCAASPALGWTSEIFINAYDQNIESANTLVLDTSPVAQAVLKLMDGREFWESTPTQLLTALSIYLEKLPKRECPYSGQTLSNALKRLEPNLLKAGIEVVHGNRKNGGNRDRLISLERVRRVESSVSDVPSQ